MHKTFAVVAGLLTSGVVWGQSVGPDQQPKFEFFAGATAAGVFRQVGPRTLFGPNLATPFAVPGGGHDGFQASAIRNLGRHFGLKLDFSTYERNQRGSAVFNESAQPLTVQSRVLNFMAGPEWKWRLGSRFTPYVHTLAGAAVVNSRFTTNGLVSLTNSDRRVGGVLAAGGGLDVRIVRRASLRFGADYMPAFLSAPLSDGSRVQQQLRLSIGVKFH